MTCVMGPVKYLCQFTFSRIDLMTVSAAISEMCTIGSVSLRRAQAHLSDSSPISEEHFSIHKHCQSSGQLDTMKGNLNSLSNGFRCSLISPDVTSQVQSSRGEGVNCMQQFMSRDQVFLSPKDLLAPGSFLLKQLKIWLQRLRCVNH